MSKIKFILEGDRLNAAVDFLSLHGYASELSEDSSTAIYEVLINLIDFAVKHRNKRLLPMPDYCPKHQFLGIDEIVVCSHCGYDMWDSEGQLHQECRECIESS